MSPFEPLVAATFIIFFTWIANLFRPKEQRLSKFRYAFIFFGIIFVRLLVGSFYLSGVETISGETEDFIHFTILDESSYRSYKMTESMRDNIYNKMMKEKKLGQDKFMLAGRKCQTLPFPEDRDNARRMFEAAISMSVGAAGGYFSLVVTLIYELGKEVDTASKEYFAMRELLEESKIHFESFDFYKNMLKQDDRM